MADLDRLLREYREQYGSGEGADPRVWLSRVEGGDRERLREMIEAFLAEAPAPDWDRAAYEHSLSASSLAGLGQSLEGVSGAWPMLLPRLRDRAHISRADLVDQLADRLGHPEQHQKVADYYNRMEQGRLPAAGVRDRVLEVLAGIVQTTKEYLRDAGRAMSIGGPGEGAQPVFARTAFPEAEFAAADPSSRREGRPELLTPAERDDVDDLFTGRDNPPRG